MFQVPSERYSNKNTRILIGFITMSMNNVHVNYCSLKKNQMRQKKCTCRSFIKNIENQKYDMQTEYINLQNYDFSKKKKFQKMRLIFICLLYH